MNRTYAVATVSLLILTGALATQSVGRHWPVVWVVIAALIGAGVLAWRNDPTDHEEDR